MEINYMIHRFYTLRLFGIFLYVDDKCYFFSDTVVNQTCVALELQTGTSIVEDAVGSKIGGESKVTEISETLFSKWSYFAEFICHQLISDVDS